MRRNVYVLIARRHSFQLGLHAHKGAKGDIKRDFCVLSRCERELRSRDTPTVPIDAASISSASHLFA